MPEPSLSKIQARELAGRQWVLDGQTYRFANYDRSNPGVMPWTSGTEGTAYPLLDTSGKITAYVKSFNGMKATIKRVQRTQWLVAQRLHEVTPELRGAPRRWLDTTIDGHPDRIRFDFACSFATAVPGQTWLETRVDVSDGVVRLDTEFRERCICNLLTGLAHLERRDIVHGDLSPNNVIVNLNAPQNEPALWLIDFDGFVATAAGTDLGRLSTGEGGTVGTRGYCPPELHRKHTAGDTTVAPFSDRFGRDMLLLELLLFDEQCDYEKPVCEWPKDQILSRLQHCPLVRQFPHLADPNIFTIAEALRPASEQLAVSLQLLSAPSAQTATRGTLTTASSNIAGTVPLSTLIARFAFRSLWLTCMTVLGLLSFSGTRLVAQWLGRGTGALSFAAQLFCATGIFVAVATPLTIRTFASTRPTAVNVLGTWFRIPARQNIWYTELEHRLRMVGVLSGLVVLVTMCLMLVW